MAQAVGKVGIELEARVGKLESDLKKVGQVVEREAHKWGKAMKQGLTSVEAETKRAADAAEAHAKRISNSFKAAFAGFTVGASLKMLSRTADEYANIAARIKLAAGANADFGRSFGQVFKVAQSTYQSLDATTRLVQKISQGLQTTGLGYQESFQKAIQLTEVFNKALVVSGAGTIQAQSAMLQFSQAIAKGRLDGDEFRSVMENNSTFMLLLAKSLGVTVGQLYKLREEGKLTTDVIMQVTQKSEYLQKLYEQFPPTIARASQQFSNAWTKFIGEADQAAGASRTLAQAISLVAGSLEEIANVAVAGGSIFVLAKAFDAISVGAVKVRDSMGGTRKAVLAFAEASVASARAAEASLAASVRAAQADAGIATARRKNAMGVIADAEKQAAALRMVVHEETRRASAAGAVIAAENAKAAAAGAVVKTYEQRIMLLGTQGKMTAGHVAALNAEAAATAESAAAMAVQNASTAQITAAKLRLSAIEAKIAVEKAAMQILYAKETASVAQLKILTDNLAAAKARLAEAEGALNAATTAGIFTWAKFKDVAGNVFAALGGWPMLLAAAMYATYAWINRETEAEAAAKATTNALHGLAAAHSALDKARAKSDVINRFNEQIKVVERLRAEFEKYEAAAEAAAAANDESAQMSFQLAMADTASALKNAQEKLVGTWRKMLDVGAATRDTSSVLGRFNSVVADMADPLSVIVPLLERMRDATTSAEIPMLSSPQSADEMVKQAQERNRQLTEEAILLKDGRAALAAYRAEQSNLSDAQKKVLEENARLEDSVEALRNARVEAAKEDREAEEKAERLAEAQRKNAQEARELAAVTGGELAVAFAKMQNEIENVRLAYDKGEIKLGDYIKKVFGLSAAYRMQAAEANRVAAAERYKDDIFARGMEHYQEEIDRMGLTGRALYQYEERLRHTAAAQELFNQKGIRIPQEQVEQLVEEAGRVYDLGIAHENIQQIIEDSERIWIDFAYDVGDAFTTFAVDVLSNVDDIDEAWENLGDSLVDTAKRAVGEMISQFLKLQIINPILNSIFGGFGGNVLPTQGNLLGNITSMFSGGGSGGGIMGWIGSLFGGGASAGGGLGLAGLGGTLGTWGAFTGYGAAGAASANLGSIGLGLTAPGAPFAGGAASVGSASGAAGAGSGLLSGSGLGTSFAGVPIIGWIAAAMAANMNLFAQGWRSGGGSLTLPNGQSVHGGSGSNALGNLLTAGGITALDRGLRGLGLSDSVASLLSGSSIHTRLFGRQAPRLTGATTTMTLGPGGPGGSEAYRTIERGGLFRSDRRRTHRFDLGDEAQAAVEALFESIEGTIREAASMLQGEAPEMISAALRVVQEFDSKGKVKATKYFVDLLGRTWEEATQEAAEQRIHAEAIIATIDAIMGTTVAAVGDAVATGTGDVVGAAGDAAVGAMAGAAGAFDLITKTAQAAQGEASAIAERWREDAEMLAEGAAFLLAAATDIRAGVGLLGDDGTLTQITDLVEELQQSGETLSQTYVRLVQSTNLLMDALDLAGVSLDLTREEFVRFAAEITDAAGGLERATQLWSSYFENFYSESERAALALSRADAGARRQFQDIGLNAEDFMGEGGGQAFRDLFESLLPTLSAEAIVQWLEAAEALGIYIDAFEEYNNSLGSVEVDNSLAEFMAGIRDELASFDQELTYAQQVSEINKEIDGLIVRAQSLGASEQDIADIRALGQARLNALAQQHLETLREQAQAQQNLDNLILLLTAETAGPLSELTGQLMGLRREYQGHVDQLNEYARAAGRAGASQEELAVASEWYAARLRQIADGLIQTGRSLVQRLYGGQGSEAETPIGMGTTWYNNETGGISEINEAVEDRYAREMELLEQLRNYLDSLKLSALSPYTPEERLMEAQRQYQSILARAQGGDLDALAQLQEAANTYLGEAQSYYGGVGAYGGIFDSVMGAIQGLVDRGPLNSPPEEGPTEVTGIGGGNIQVDPGEGFAALGELERRALAAELATVMRDIMILTGDSLLQVSEQLGVDLVALVADLGVNLDEMTVATTLQLATISNQLGVDLTELATAVGFHLGQLGDEQSLLNDALETVIAGLPEGIGNDLSEYLTAIEAATIDGDPNAALEDMQNYINSLPAGIRTQLAPFFEGVGTPEQLLLAATIDIGHDILALKTSTLNIESSASSLANTLFRVEGILSSHGGLLAEVNTHLERIAENTAPEAPEPPPPPTPEEAPEYIGEYEDSDGVVVELRSMKAEISAALKMIATSSKDVSDSNRTIAKAVTTNAGPRGKM